MHSRGSRVFALILSLSLVEAPAFAAPKPLGLILQTNRARLGSTIVQTGTTVYPGDAVVTDAAGTVSLRLGAAQAYLGGSAQASFDESEGRVVVQLARGTLGFTVSGEESLLVYAAGLWIRPQTAGATHAEVTVTGSHDTVITAVRGPLEVIDEGESFVVAEASSYEFTQEPAGVGADQVKKKKRRRLAGAILLIGAIVTCVVLYNTHPSPSSPTHTFCR